MPFFIVTEEKLVLPGEYTSYELTCAACEAGETVYLADSRQVLEETLEAEGSG